LEGILAGETSISTVEGGLSYRGYLVTDLASHATFEEVAYLLLHGDLPNTTQLAAFQQRLAAARVLPAALRDLLGALPPATPSMDALRSAVSVLAHFDPETAVSSHEANVRKAERLLGEIPVAIAYQYRLSRGLPVVPPRADLPHTANFLYMLNGKEPPADHAHAFDVSLILYAEHEFNASTFAARVICSTESDLHSGIVGAVGALKGRLHGGANEQVMDLLRKAGGPDTAEAWIREALARKEKIMGFGHRVYKAGDVRARFLRELTRKMAEAAGETKWEETAEIIEQVMEKEKHLLPNLDWPAGRLYHALGLDVHLYTPIFVMSRVGGWRAHVSEQADHNRLIRPRSRYTGPQMRKIVPRADRS
jgi:citrate synthase